MGIFEWAFGGVGVFFIQQLYTILERKLVFDKEVRQVILKDEKDLRQILDDRFEEKNIGGLVVIQDVNSQFEDKKILKPSHIGLKRVKGDNSLVNLAIEGKVKITKVILQGTGNPYSVKLNVENISRNQLSIEIPKGQIFENKEYKAKTQNLATSDTFNLLLRPSQSEDIVINAFCFNQTFPPPRNVVGNITIYEFSDKDYSTNGELWRKISNNLTTNMPLGVDSERKYTFSFRKDMTNRILILAGLFFICLVIYLLPLFL